MTPEAETAAVSVVDVPVADELDESFVAYAMSVITSRAIPDARDGLKPVQRRILWTMRQMGATHDKPHRKSARVVGDTMGRYHPHGDKAIYDALVRMGQAHSMRVPMIDPQGNFGSLDDPPAASRYTECRHAAAAAAMLDGASEETVDWLDSYDGEGREPAVLPSGIPNLLVNGSSGIAVGIATNIWPHNLSEVAAAVKAMMDAEDGGRVVKTSTLMKRMPGPDWPTGGVVTAGDGLLSAYETGKGSVKVSGKWHAEPGRRGRQCVVITETPPGVGPERLVERISAAVEAEKLPLVSGVADHSDRAGLRIVVTLVPGADPDEAAAELRSGTPLEVSEHMNCVALVGGVPKTLPLKETLECWVKHRMQVVLRRTAHRLGRNRRRLKLVEASDAAGKHIQEVIETIRTAPDAAAAGRKLKKLLDIDDEQAEYVLSLTLRSINRLDRRKLAEEMSALKATIAKLEELLASEPKRREAIRKELTAAVREHGTPRRTLIAAEGAAAAGAARDRVVSVSARGRVVVGPAQRGTGPDSVSSQILSPSGPSLAVTSDGKVHRVPAEAGTVEPAQFGVNPVVGVTEPGASTLIVASDGSARLAEIATDGIEAIKLKAGAKVVAAFPADPDAECVAVSSDGQVIRISDSQASPRAAGSRFIGLNAGASVVAAARPGPDDHVVIASNAGRAICFGVDQVPARQSGARGVMGIKLAGGQKVAAAAVGAAPKLRLGYPRGKRKPVPPAAKSKRGGQGAQTPDGKIAGAGTESP